MAQDEEIAIALRSTVFQPQMFESTGIAREIDIASTALASGEDIHLSERLLKISLANPTKRQLAHYVNGFREAGVDLPCLYPYFQSKEDEAFKIRKVEENCRLA